MTTFVYVCDNSDKADEAEGLCKGEGCPTGNIKRYAPSTVVVFDLGDGETLIEKENAILVTGVKP